MHRELTQKRNKTLTVAFKIHMSQLDPILQTILGVWHYMISFLERRNKTAEI